MKLIFAFSAFIAIAFALSKSDNPQDAENVKDGAIKIEGQDTAIINAVNDGVPSEPKFLDLKTRVFKTMTSDELEKLNFTEDQKAWFGGALDRLEQARNQVNTVNANAILFQEMSENQKNGLGLSQAQVVWSIGVINNLVNHMKQNIVREDANVKGASNKDDLHAHHQNDKEVVKTTTGTTVMKETTTATTEVLKTPITETTTSVSDEKKKEAPKPKPSTKVVVKKNNTKQESKSAGAGAHATTDIWTVFGGVLAAVVLIFL